jgi:hypothetical protein
MEEKNGGGKIEEERMMRGKNGREEWRGRKEGEE